MPTSSWYFQHEHIRIDSKAQKDAVLIIYCGSATYFTQTDKFYMQYCM